MSSRRDVSFYTYISYPRPTILTRTRALPYSYKRSLSPTLCRTFCYYLQTNCRIKRKACRPLKWYCRRRRPGSRIVEQNRKQFQAAEKLLTEAGMFALWQSPERETPGEKALDWQVGKISREGRQLALHNYAYEWLHCRAPICTYCEPNTASSHLNSEKKRGQEGRERKPMRLESCAFII